MSDAATRDRDQAAAREATAAREKSKQAVREQHDRRIAAHRELSAKSEEVMANSRPTPTQEENDLLRIGAMDPMDIEPQDAPEMPPLHEQQAQIAEAERDPHREHDQRRRRERDERRPPGAHAERQHPSPTSTRTVSSGGTTSA